MKKFNKIIIGIIISTSILTLGYNNIHTNNFKSLISINSFKTSVTTKELNKNDIINNSEFENKNIKQLIFKIKVEKANNFEKYDRNAYTSNYQKYIFKEETYRSIRAYAFAASVHYDNGVYTSPYDNKNYTMKEMDYDHIIPLSYADVHGADNWDDVKKKSYADNPIVGIDVNLHDNRSKGDKGPYEWLPEKNVESYCYTWLVLADKYNLSIAPKDMDVIKEKLNNVNESDLKIINKYNE